MAWPTYFFALRRELVSSMLHKRHVRDVMINSWIWCTVIGAIVGLAIPLLLISTALRGMAPQPQDSGLVMPVLSEFLLAAAWLPASGLDWVMPTLTRELNYGVLALAWLAWGTLGAAAGAACHVLALGAPRHAGQDRHGRVWSAAGWTWRAGTLLGLATIVWPTTVLAMLAAIGVHPALILLTYPAATALTIYCWVLLANSGRGALGWSLLWGLTGLCYIMVELVWAKAREIPIEVQTILSPPAKASPILLIVLVASQFWVAWNARRLSMQLRETTRQALNDLDLR